MTLTIKFNGEVNADVLYYIAYCIEEEGAECKFGSLQDGTTWSIENK